MSSIDKKLKATRTDLDPEIGKQQSQIELLSQSIASILERRQVVENGEHLHSIYRSPGESNTFFENDSNPLNNADITIIASNIPKEPKKKNILEISKEFINSLNESVDVVAAA